MSTYLTDSAAREHANALLAEAARSRRLHEAREARRTAKQAVAGRSGNRTTRSLRRPFAAAHHWLIAGDL